MKRKSQQRIGAVAPSPPLGALSLSTGKRARLWRLLYGHGPANGTLMILPLDQGLEHGPADFFPNPQALDPAYQVRLALEGGYSAIALGIGLAERYLAEAAGRLPLVLKLKNKGQSGQIIWDGARISRSRTAPIPAPPRRAATSAGSRRGSWSLSSRRPLSR